MASMTGSGTPAATASAPSTSNTNNTFTWNADQINALVNTQAAALRVARQALKPIGMQGMYVDSVLGHRVDRGKALTVRPNQHLQPLQMSRYITLAREQLNDNEAFQSMALYAAADIAQAEDAVVLLGADAGPFLATLMIELDQPSELSHQEGLFEHNQIDVAKPILDSILEGIETLQKRAQFGAYYVIVSPALYREAYTNQKTPLDAPINQIKPLLVDNGFLFSEAASSKKGVIFSLARATINLAIPIDSYLERLTDDDKGQLRFRVAEQMRLVIDDRDARAALK